MLNKFWENLRDKSRVTISHPDLPDELKDAAGALAVTLWKTAMGQATKSLEAFRHETQIALNEAAAARQVATAERDKAIDSFQSVSGKLAAMSIEIAVLREDASALVASKLAVEAQLLEAKDAIVAQYERFDLARRQHNVELDKLREDIGNDFPG